MTSKKVSAQARKGSGLAVGAACMCLALLLNVSPVAAHASVICDGQTATIVGTNGDDVLFGTDGDDVIAGLGGNDTISGLGGDDRICGGLGEDTLYGEDDVFTPPATTGGNDRIFGQEGGDLLIGDFGNFSGPAGTIVFAANDYIDGGADDDIIAGASLEASVTVTTVSYEFDNDTLLGGHGSDTIYGQVKHLTYTATGPVLLNNGNTIIDGGEGADTIYGDWETFAIAGSGSAVTNGWRDTIIGGDGSDTIYGDALNGNDQVSPNRGGADDTIDGGSGTDNGDAGPGIDTCTDTESVTSCES